MRKSGFSGPIYCIEVFEMTTNSCVTIWHFDEQKEVWTRQDFPKAHIYAKQKLGKNGIKQKGFYDASGCVVRIPQAVHIEVVPGDYLHIGSYNATAPQKEQDMKVIEVSDNRRGGSPHWRISCGG